MNKKNLTVFLCLAVTIAALNPLMIFAKDENRVFFESFEDGRVIPPDGWKISGDAESVCINIENASHGTKSIQLTSTTKEASLGVQSSKIAVEANNSYTVITDVYNLSGQCSLYLKFQDSDGAEVGTASVSNSIANFWTTISVTNQAPPNATTATVILYIGKAVLGDVLFDNVIIIKEGTDLASGKGIAPEQAAPVHSKLITPDGEGLKYSAYNEQGDKLSDYSYAGFYAGEIELPASEKICVAATISPSASAGEDDTKRIQDIIDSVAVSVGKGEMAIVRLEAGRYNINKNGLLLKDGIILSGSGQGPNGTILYAPEAVQYTVLKIAGGAPTRIGDKVNITDDYVKSGSNEVNVAAEEVSKFSVGDLITIYHPSTDEWAKALGMSSLLNLYDDPTPWPAGKVDVPTERIITDITGTTITFDFPLFVPLDKTYSQSYIYKTNDSQRITHFGVENLRFESYYNGSYSDEAHASTAISITNAKNGFVRNVSAKHFVLYAVLCGAHTKQITVLNCSSLEPISQIAGSRRYAFACSTSAQQILYTGCYSYSGRHDYTSSYSASGPLAFVDNVADLSNTSSETHGTWTTGLLYDNLYHINSGTKGFIAFANRGIYGTAISQGWTGAGCVAWNCLSNTILANKPPSTYQNFLIGVWGRYLDNQALNVKRSNISANMMSYRTDTISVGEPQFFETTDETPFVGDVYKEAETTPVEPRSIYKAQLALRLTGNYKNYKPNAPIISTPRSDTSVEGTIFELTGIYQMGAEKVTVFVDDKPHNALLDENTHTFSLELNLTEGWHKIYATQTINGIEGVKNADRFIMVGKKDDKSNPSYLSSVYKIEKTSHLICDPRVTYDEHQKSVSVADENEINVFLNGKRLDSDVDAIEMNGRVLVPMRTIFEGLYADVSWDDKAATATAARGDTTVKVTEGSERAYVNDKEIILEVPASIISGRFMVPVRFIAESFGADVDWVDNLRVVTISSSFAVYEPQHEIENILTVYGAEQSGDDGAGQVIRNTLDGNFTSYWAASGTKEDGSWGVYDLGSVKSVSDIYIAYSSGRSRVYTFSVEVSVDGKNYTRVIDNQDTSGATSDFERYSLNGVSARYIKYIGYGNNQNAWNSITEMAFAE